MDAALLKRSLDDWDEVLRRVRSALIERDVPPLPPKGSSAALVGVRRAGKTHAAIAMTRAFPQERVLYYNFEDPVFYADPHVRHLDQLLAVAEEYREVPIECLVLDEIQNIEGWERWLRKLIALGRYHIIVTGSSAKLLSSEISTALAGRTLSYTIWPLSLAEHLRFRKEPRPGDRRRQKAHLRQLMAWGAFPEVVLSDDRLHRQQLLRQYLTDIVLRDVISRRQIRNKRAFDQILTYYFTNPSSLHSYSALRKAFGVTADTAADYTAGLQDAFVVFEVHRYHANLKVQRRDPKKIYVIDPGLRMAGARSVSDDTGKLLENLVYLELRRRDLEVSYYRGAQEVDFLITERYKPTQAIQVCATGLDDPKTYAREINALVECLQALGLSEGTIVTLDDERQVDVDGLRIAVIPATRWLIEPSKR